MALPAGLDALWGYATPSLERARALIELINYDPAAATPEAVEARLPRDAARSRGTRSCSRRRASAGSTTSR